MYFEKFLNVFNIYHQRRILKFIKKLDIEYIIDVGAHKGEFLNSVLKLNCKKIYCFEPQKEIFKTLHKNYKNNKKVELFNLGLSDKNAKLKFYINKLTSTSTFSKSKKTFFRKFKNLILNSDKNYLKSYYVKTKKLDQFFISKKKNNIFLKIDVEGFEFNVLKGAKKLLANKVKYILVEKHFFKLYQNNSTTKVDLFLKKNNFKLLKKFSFPLLYFQDNLYIKKIKNI